MKKITSLISVLILVVLMSGCTGLTSIIKREKATKYNDIQVTFITTQGEISMYLYPEAAPITVANFINLAKRGYYDNTKIHRAIDNFMVQGGDPTGTGTGGPGYFIQDEIVDWLDFFQPGMLAMANAGPNTGGSQFFITTNSAEWLNGKHTIFGEYIADTDFNNVKKLEVGDIIKSIKFKGEVDFFLALHKDEIEEWNKILDEKFPELKKYPIKNIDDFDGEVSKYKKELKEIYSKKEDTRTEKEWFIPKVIRKVEKTIED